MIKKYSPKYKIKSPTLHDRIYFLQSRFTIIFYNLTETNYRKRMKAVAVKQFCQKLNEQVNH
jgi:ribosomal protein L33